MVDTRAVGVDRRNEINPDRFVHDMTRQGTKFARTMSTPTAAMVIYVMLCGVSAIIPAFVDVCLLIGVGLYFFINKAHGEYHLPAKMPKHSFLLDPLELKPGRNEKTFAAGTFYLGIDKDTKEEIWLSNRDAGVHALILGTTGSGKTELLLGICQNALNQGSGFMFVDGKAQDKIAFKLMDLTVARGRHDDFMVLNFMTGAKDIIGPQSTKSTNTLNPFSYGSSGMVSQIVVGLMSSGGGGDDMWKDRAISFVEALAPPLVYLRDHYNIMLDVNEFRKYFEIERIEELAWRGGEMYPGLDQVLDAAKNYLINLPGYDQAKIGKRGGQGEDTRVQHGYITMQLVRAFTSLADTYGHIVRVPIGEVFFPDLVNQRRILVVMLPSLEKTPSETANIGKIIVTALRNIMASGLGAVLEGDRDVLDNADGRNLLPPYVVILDEYGYYAVKGFAVAFAQARSLGFVCVVGGQDLASFQKESKEESVSICGNTRIKFFGSIEDPEQTMNFVVQTAGKAMVAKANSYEADVGMMGTSFNDNMQVHFDTVDRINPSDIKMQVEGEFHIVWRKYVIRAQTYFVDPKKIKKVRLNHFIMVEPPNADQLEKIDVMTSGLVEMLGEVEMSSSMKMGDNSALDSAKAYLENARTAQLGSLESVICSIAGVTKSLRESKEAFKEDIRKGGSGSEVIGELRKTSSFAPIDDDDLLPDPSTLVAPASRGGNAGAVKGGSGIRPNDMVRADGTAEIRAVSVFSPQAAGSGFVQDVFAGDPARSHRMQSIINHADDGSSMLDYNDTFNRVRDIEEQMGSTPEQASAVAAGVVQNIEQATMYPKSIPPEKSADQIASMVGSLISILEDEQ